MESKNIQTDCCGDENEFLIADEFGGGRVRVEGNCPTCGAEEPRGTVIVSEEGDENSHIHNPDGPALDIALALVANGGKAIDVCGPAENIPAFVVCQGCDPSECEVVAHTTCHPRRFHLDRISRDKLRTRVNGGRYASIDCPPQWRRPAGS